MKKNKMREIASETGLSISAISKGINHCSGLTTSTRETILRFAGDFVSSKKRVDSVDVYIIMPDTPSYFWRSATDSLMEVIKAGNCRAKLNLSTTAADEFTVLCYLDEASALNAKAIVICADLTDRLAERLSEFAETGTAVFLLEKFRPIKNTFYYGSDREEDGRLLGEKMLSDGVKTDRIVMIGEDDLREKGLRSVLIDVDIRRISFDFFSVSYASAMLARLLSAEYEKKPFDCAICLDGVTDRTCLALKKCGFSVPCYGFENSPECGKYLDEGILKGLVCQNVGEMSREAGKAVLDYTERGVYPEKKLNFYKSFINFRQ